MPWELCTKDDVKSILPTPKTALKDVWSEISEGLIREKLGMTHLGKPEEPFTETLDGNGTAIIRPKHLPIKRVESLVVDGYNVPANEYSVNDTMIRLKYGTTTKGVGNVTVSYVSGGVEVPQNVRFTAMMMVGACVTFYRRAGADASVKWSQLAEKKVATDETSVKVAGLVPYLKNVMNTHLTLQRLRIG